MRRRNNPLSTKHAKKNNCNPPTSSKGDGKGKGHMQKEQSITPNNTPTFKNQSSENPTTASNTIMQIRPIRTSTVDTHKGHRRMAHLLSTHTQPKHKTTWTHSAANKFRQLANGVGECYKRTNTIFFISKDIVLADQMRDVTYGSFSCT
jgi:hypothetical protein